MRITRHDLEACSALKLSADLKLQQRQKILDMLARCTATYGKELVQTTREKDPISRWEAASRDIEMDLENETLEHLERVNRVKLSLIHL